MGGGKIKISYICSVHVDCRTYISTLHSITITKLFLDALQQRKI